MNNKEARGGTYLRPGRSPVERGSTVVAYSKGAKRFDICGLLLDLCGLFAQVLRDAFGCRVQLEAGLDPEEVLGEERVWFARHARLEDGEAVFELTDPVAHLCDFAVETVRVGEDEPGAGACV